MHKSALFFWGKQPLTNNVIIWQAPYILITLVCNPSLCSLSLDRRDKNSRPRLTAITVRVHLKVLNQSRGNRWSNSSRGTRGSRPPRHLCVVSQWWGVRKEGHIVRKTTRCTLIGGVRIAAHHTVCTRQCRVTAFR